jgi:putative transposase
MKPIQHTAEQIIKILEQAEKGEQTVTEVCREHGIAENTFYRWRKAYGGMSLNEVQRLKDLEKENARIKRLLAERDLEVDALKELLAKNCDDRPDQHNDEHLWHILDETRTDAITRLDGFLSD